VGARAPHAAPLDLDFAALIERASARLMKAGRGRRIARFSHRTRPTSSARERASSAAARREPAVDAARRARRLREARRAPVRAARSGDAVFVTDDSLVAPLLAGLERARVRVRRDVHVLAHCTWPRPLGVAEGVEHIGFDAREVLAAAKESPRRATRGRAVAGPRRAPALRHEVLTAPTTRRAPEARTAPADLETLRRGAEASPRLSERRVNRPWTRQRAAAALPSSRRAARARGSRALLLSACRARGLRQRQAARRRGGLGRRGRLVHGRGRVARRECRGGLAPVVMLPEPTATPSFQAASRVRGPCARAAGAVDVNLGNSPRTSCAPRIARSTAASRRRTS